MGLESDFLGEMKNRKSRHKVHDNEGLKAEEYGDGLNVLQRFKQIQKILNFTFLELPNFGNYTV